MKFGIGFGVLSVVYSSIAVSILSALGLNFSGGILGDKNVNYVRVFITAVVAAPIIEEFLFRTLPIKLFASHTKIVQNIVIFLTSFVLFGWLHGGPQFMLIQGVTGLLYAYVYLKRGYFTSVIAHATHNAIVVTLIILFSI
ncbi:MAG: hypothetical protein A3F94_02540 [Candidatus Spechtbacteria bacterium RIFCSPLOWO2_12_FULL_38_22]|uniref:CAAX prenyl protease 2/Lysostaphin resistance protein A-like domain-containing protein n=1 Tax=Candidatus Spechtbacteria bacterium RIFCSPLOWO2_12_FULL_38_22 TaxID=1802165 RepID=A0A1G2HHV9_9BACT|nr:MAG: hypothetical protein A2728_01115 [Candidatus Spechtbacteria bacterium RIFCSPHIGHO2_01_FULL_38_11]OGZ59457.1 MAG: hypothetical protein A3E58_00750 [Candidatus Spechtbacteria bacterium RIFCSPHIGHO2_12_FULL_38_30]OGZ61142.1 MAG: hypothetical protein A3A00_01050 [Candidatus Spechtbacteria bacterium RIFCSPLOWO2_01_FULL_38_20]OGZ62086.1 MAG: hypothetical protein A3F94_02540 [Candidatus Spechtbacteria bacterium RIFCSPLOWO2_12_FULL_38_22]